MALVGWGGTLLPWPRRPRLLLREGPEGLFLEKKMCRSVEFHLGVGGSSSIMQAVSSMLVHFPLDPWWLCLRCWRK